MRAEPPEFTSFFYNFGLFTNCGNVSIFVIDSEVYQIFLLSSFSDFRLL